MAGRMRPEAWSALAPAARGVNVERGIAGAASGQYTGRACERITLPLSYSARSAAMTIAPPETLVVTEKSVSCDGGDGALGHPRVFLNMGDQGWVECPYCDRKFVLKDGPADTGSEAA